MNEEVLKAMKVMNDIAIGIAVEAVQNQHKLELTLEQIQLRILNDLGYEITLISVPKVNRSVE